MEKEYTPKPVDTTGVNLPEELLPLIEESYTHLRAPQA